MRSASFLVVAVLAACSSNQPGLACNSAEVISTLERIHMDQWNEAVKAERDAHIEVAMIPVAMEARLPDGSIGYWSKEQRDSIRRSMEAEADAQLPKRSLVYSNTITEANTASGVTSCKAQVDLNVNGVKQASQMSAYTARYTDDGQVYVEATRLGLQEQR